MVSWHIARTFGSFVIACEGACRRPGCDYVSYGADEYESVIRVDRHVKRYTDPVQLHCEGACQRPACLYVASGNDMNVAQRLLESHIERGKARARRTGAATQAKPYTCLGVYCHDPDCTAGPWKSTGTRSSHVSRVKRDRREAVPFLKRMRNRSEAENRMPGASTILAPFECRGDKCGVQGCEHGPWSTIGNLRLHGQDYTAGGPKNRDGTWDGRKRQGRPASTRRAPSDVVLSGPGAKGRGAGAAGRGGGGGGRARGGGSVVTQRDTPTPPPPQVQPPTRRPQARGRGGRQSDTLRAFFQPRRGRGQGRAPQPLTLGAFMPPLPPQAPPPPPDRPSSPPPQLPSVPAPVPASPRPAPLPAEASRAPSPIPRFPPPNKRGRRP